MSDCLVAARCPDGRRWLALPCVAHAECVERLVGELPWTDADFEDGPSEAMLRRAVDLAARPAAAGAEGAR